MAQHCPSASKVVHTTAESATTSVPTDALTALSRWFNAGFTLFDAHHGVAVHHDADMPRVDWSRYAEPLRLISQGNRAALIEEEDPVIAVALPVVGHGDHPLAALGLFVTRRVDRVEEIQRAAEILGVSCQNLFVWAQSQPIITAHGIECLAELASTKLAADARINELEQESEILSRQISATFEEISLIYRLTQNLKLSSNKEELGQMALSWLEEVVAVDGVAIQFLSDDHRGAVPAEYRGQSQLLAHGKCPVDNATFTALIEHLKLEVGSRPVVINRSWTDEPGWPFDDIHQLILVPVAESQRLFGWLAAFNHSEDQEFGTPEASLMSSVGTILGIHSSNLDLYRQQAEVLSGIVRAMSSAIDAKDPYTRGHSDRVARVAVRLAQELGCDTDTLKTIYLAGLLHDIGKIGIDDNVLRKPGKLTEAEYEHVKTHVEIGHRILRDLPKMGHMLPVVLHHHESWDGSGYPFGLSGSNIPFLARIAAVADAYDAMASDRPYRAGMPDEKLDAIIRDGAGKQWDPTVVEAFFRARGDINEISQKTTDDDTPLQFS